MTGLNETWVQFYELYEFERAKFFCRHIFTGVLDIKGESKGKYYCVIVNCTAL